MRLIYEYRRRQEEFFIEIGLPIPEEERLSFDKKTPMEVVKALTDKYMSQYNVSEVLDMPIQDNGIDFEETKFYDSSNANFLPDRFQFRYRKALYKSPCQRKHEISITLFGDFEDEFLMNIEDIKDNPKKIRKTPNPEEFLIF